MQPLIVIRSLLLHKSTVFFLVFCLALSFLGPFRSHSIVVSRCGLLLPRPLSYSKEALQRIGSFLNVVFLFCRLSLLAVCFEFRLICLFFYPSISPGSELVLPRVLTDVFFL